jgi:hypothetical protein
MEPQEAFYRQGNQIMKMKRGVSNHSNKEINYPDAENFNHNDFL